MWHHLLLLVPIIGLALFFILPWPAALPIYGPLAVVAVAVFVAGYRALRLPVKTGPEGMVGRAARVVTTLRPHGIVRYQGELWQAAADETLHPGTRVRIVGVEGLKLEVSRDAPS